MRGSASAVLALAVSVQLLAVACAPDDHPAAPARPAPSPASATSADHVPGASVRVSPLGYVVFARPGTEAKSFAFTAQLADSAGASLPIPAAGLDWALLPGQAFRADADSVSGDRRTATLVVRPVARGRDAVLATHGAAADTAFAERWEWLAPDFTWQGGAWTPAGDSRCVQVSQEDGSAAVDLSSFELYAASFNPAIVRVDSASVGPGGRSARICFTAQGSGATDFAMAGRDTASHRYWGWRHEHAVLTPPLSLGFEHGEAYEIGVGQRTRLNARLRDGNGASVLLDGESGAVSWTNGDSAVATVDAGGAVQGVASGTARLSAAWRDLTAQATVDVYEIVGGLVGEENICVSTRRGTVRCWGSSDEYHPLLGYGVARSNLGVVRPVQVADVDVGGVVRDFFLASNHAACAITTDGALRCWGSPNWGSLGYGNDRWIGDDEPPSAAGPVPLGGAPAYVGGGRADHFCTVLVSGGLRCVGSNLAGQLGYGISHAVEPVVGDDETPADMGDVPLGGKAVQVATGGRAGMTCAVLDNGRGRCWGINAQDWFPETGAVSTPTRGLGYGRAHGYDSPIGDDETPADVGDLPLDDRIVMFALGGHHICAIMEGGTVRCWGSNYHGQRGAGLPEEFSVADASESVELFFPSPAVQIVAGWQHTCVLMENGSVRCWGGNYHGVLGLGDTRGRGIEESAEDVEDVPLGGPAARLLAAGSAENCAVMRAGGLRCWGANWSGHFGYPFDEDVGDDETPAEVGDIMVFPGPVPQNRLGTARSRGASGWVSPARSARWAAMRLQRRPEPVPSVYARAAGASQAAADSPSGSSPRPTWLGPLTGAGGFVEPGAVPPSAEWIKVEARGR